MEFEEWVAAEGGTLLRFAYLVIRDHDRAEEAVQDALVRAFPRWHRIRELGDPAAYLRRAVVNANISRWRQTLRRESPTDSPTGRPEHPDPAADQAERDAVWALCATLPVKQRAAVVLRYYEDLPDAEIATILGCSPSTVRSQIHRALATLRTSLNATEEGVPR